MIGSPAVSSTVMNMALSMAMVMLAVFRKAVMRTGLRAPKFCEIIT